MKPSKNTCKLNPPIFELDRNMPNYDNDPYFIKKTERAKESFLKYDLAGKLRQFLTERETITKEKNEII